jgi:acetyltransferase-like isoleucine patch superfamily enzyme
MLIKNDKPLAAISYDTRTFGQLGKFVQADGTNEITRIEPSDFLKNPTSDFQYINLVIKDFDQRKQISAVLDQHNLDRFTYIGHDSTDSLFHVSNITVGKGCMIFPWVRAYSGNIGNDVVVHSMTVLAEDVQIGNGSFVSGGVTIAGGCKIGNWCFLGNNLFFMDNVSICDNVKLIPGTNIRKSITEPGTYYNPYTYKIEKILV